MKKTLTLLAAFIALTSCGTSDLGVAPQPAPTITVQPSPAPLIQPPLPISPRTAVQRLVDAENTYRESLGLTYLTPGLTCSVQAISGGQWLSSSSPGYQAAQGVITTTGTTYNYLFQASFDQPNATSGPNNLIPAPIQGLFIGDDYKIVCYGNIVLVTDGYYSFDMSSDDGSILAINGGVVLNMDGNHAITEGTAVKYYRHGVYTFNLQYAQSGLGSFGLLLSMNGSLIPPTLWFH